MNTKIADYVLCISPLHKSPILTRVLFAHSDASQTTPDSQAYTFNMSNLVVLLKRQAEKNVAASYFNVDILKYQVTNKFTVLLTA